MVIRIARSAPLLWRSPDSLQVGSGQKATRLEALNLAEQRLIRLLQSGVHDPDFNEVAADVGVEAAQAKAMLHKLEPVLEREHRAAKPARGKPGDGDGLTPEFVTSAVAEIVRANLRYRVDGRLILKRRSTTQVYVETLDRTGLILARALAAAGIGKIVSGDCEAVQVTDVGPDGYPARTRFARRSQAAEIILTQGYGSVETVFDRPHPAVLGKTNLAILVAHGSLEPERHLRWLRMGVAHIALVFSDDGARVSPVVSGRPCLLCDDFERADRDPAWPILAAQLQGYSVEFADTASRWMATARAIRRILAFVDGAELPDSRDRPATMATGHPDCACALVAGGDVGQKP